MTDTKTDRTFIAGRGARRTPVLLAAFALAVVFLLTSVATGATGSSETGGADKTQPETFLFMDVHNLGAGNVTLEAVAEAHAADLAIQDDYGVEYRHYWVNEEEGKVYCLVSAPDAETAAEVHRQAHGLVADEIHKVEEGD